MYEGSDRKYEDVDPHGKNIYEDSKDSPDSRKTRSKKIEGVKGMWDKAKSSKVCWVVLGCGVLVVVSVVSAVILSAYIKIGNTVASDSLQHGAEIGPKLSNSSVPGSTVFYVFNKGSAVANMTPFARSRMAKFDEESSSNVSYPMKTTLGPTIQPTTATFKATTGNNVCGYMYSSLGCWKDTPSRAIPMLEGKDARLDGTDPTKRDNATEKCFQVARSRGFPVFAVQYGGQCFGSANGHNTYNKYGPSEDCAADGKGGSYANEVYKITGQRYPNKYCYKFVTEHVNWASAMLKCKEQGAFLVSITNSWENNFITSLIAKATIKDVWIGLRRDGKSWKWSSDGSRATYTNWYPGQPSNTPWHGGEDCGSIYSKVISSFHSADGGEMDEPPPLPQKKAPKKVNKVKKRGMYEGLHKRYEDMHPIGESINEDSKGSAGSRKTKRTEVDKTLEALSSQEKQQEGINEGSDRKYEDVDPHGESIHEDSKDHVDVRKTRTKGIEMEKKPKEKQQQGMNKGSDRKDEDVDPNGDSINEDTKDSADGKTRTKRTETDKKRKGAKGMWNKAMSCKVCCVALHVLGCGVLVVVSFVIAVILSASSIKVGYTTSASVILVTAPVWSEMMDTNAPVLPDGLDWNVLGEGARVVIFNRRDCCCCSKRLNPFNIHIGNSDQVSTNPKCGGDHHINLNKPSISVSCQGMRGRYVAVRLPGPYRILTLCEVQVFSGHKPTSCAEAKSLRSNANDGEYILYPFSTDRDVSLRVYCHGMASGEPKEFLTLPSGPDENYAIVFSDRLVRHWGCTGPLQGCAKGTFKVNLAGTGLALAPEVHWVMGHYYPASLTINDMFVSEDRKVASARCGGYCGHCQPDREKIYLAPSQGGNVALGKTAHQTSTRAEGGPASRAVDGNTNTNFIKSGSCTHTVDTPGETNPTWWVDLGQSYAVDRVVIFNRRDCCCCSKRLNPFNIHIGNSDQVSTNPKCGGDHHINLNKPTISVSCQGMRGQYVAVRLPGPYRILTLCEVQVFSGFPGYTAWYKVVAESMTYDAAAQTCAADGGRLAVVKSQDLQDFLVAMIAEVNAGTDYWIGLLQMTGGWTWSDGTAVNSGFTNWAPGEPTNVADINDVWIGLHKDGESWKWSDGSRVTYTNWHPGQPSNGVEECVTIHSKNIRLQQHSSVRGNGKTVRPAGRGRAMMKAIAGILVCLPMGTGMTTALALRLDRQSGNDEGHCRDPGVPANGSRDDNSTSFAAGQTVSKYDDDENCEWWIMVQEGSIIRLLFDSFNVEYIHDSLTIYDGASDSATQLKRLTGQQTVSPITSTSNMMFLRFTSDRSVTRQGFQFSYLRCPCGWGWGVTGNGKMSRSVHSWGSRVSRHRVSGLSGEAPAVLRLRPTVWGPSTIKSLSVFNKIYAFQKVPSEENQGNGPIFMDDLQCAGNESSLFNCSYAGWGIYNCRHVHDVGVACDSSRIRLVGGSGPHEGRVEVRPTDSFRWGRICHNQFDLKDADVVCRMFGYPSSHQVRDADKYFSNDTIRIRLTGGSGPDEGRVEVRQDGGLTWGTVCQDHFDMRDADVVCRMLGFPTAQAVRNDAYFGQDIDACLANPCDAQATCTDNPAPALDATCNCNIGYTGDGLTSGTGCTDIDACLANPCDAQATCTDNPAPALDATCSCNIGYTGDGLASGTGCTDIDACLANPCDAQATCTDNPAPALDATCSCNTGYTGDGLASGTGCADIDACLANPCDAQATCWDNPAPALDATCICNTGYAGDGLASGTGCTDIDACLANPCDAKATCTDNPAPALDATCTCNIGYTGDGLTSGTGCADIDACLANPCDAQATCWDNPAPALDATCICNPGYAGDGLTSGTGCAGCLSGYTAYAGACFKAYNQEKTYDQARQVCEEDGAGDLADDEIGMLALPKDKDVNNFLRDLKNAVSEFSRFWIGLSDQKDEGEWRWADGTEHDPIADWNSWQLGEPNDNQGGEDCANYGGSGWNDAPCSSAYKFICQLRKGYFRCGHGRACILSWKRCNGVTDCTDGSDETGCVCQPIPGDFQIDIRLAMLPNQLGQTTFEEAQNSSVVELLNSSYGSSGNYHPELRNFVSTVIFPQCNVTEENKTDCFSSPNATETISCMGNVTGTQLVPCRSWCEEVLYMAADWMKGLLPGCKLFPSSEHGCWNPNSAKKGNEVCYKGIGINYRGTRSKTTSGADCVEWSAEQAGYYKTEYPWANLDNNYCRNPTGLDRPFCLTEDGSQEDCDVIPCDADGCWDRGPPNYGKRSPGKRFYYVDDRVTYTCNEGYTLKSGYTSEARILLLGDLTKKKQPRDEEADLTDFPATELINCAFLCDGKVDVNDGRPCDGNETTGQPSTPLSSLVPTRSTVLLQLIPNLKGVKNEVRELAKAVDNKREVLKKVMMNEEEVSEYILLAKVLDRVLLVLYIISIAAAVPMTMYLGK
uniref:Deleted in malignant brain tumors 1 protein n=1 Tax=Branchiostoma floridae TaxID=7739 RepID=C3XZU2_BRAFL|eukprot:XP_002610480.1 hypothetical protein BRAFLDRAFT_85621 [Branchiostoma floridae]